MRKVSPIKVIIPLWILSFSGLASLGLVIMKLNPFVHTGLALSFFFLTFFMTGLGLFSLILIQMKKKWIEEDLLYKHYLISVRQGLFLSLCFTVCLFLLVLGMLKIWSGLLVVLFMVFVEFYFGQHDDL